MGFALESKLMLAPGPSAATLSGYRLTGGGRELAPAPNVAVRGLSASAAVGLDSYKQKDFGSGLSASALLGSRYNF